MPSPPDDEDPFARLRRSLMLGEKPVRADAIAAGMSAGADRAGDTLITLSAERVSDADDPVETPKQDEAGGLSPTPEPEDHAEAMIAEAAHFAPEGGDPALESEGEAAEAREPEPGPETAAEPAAPEGPAISEEGIVSVRHIGDSTYTMFADGSVKAQTPDSVLHFASVAELKAHLANPMR
jgi:hypothetical protein